MYGGWGWLGWYEGRFYTDIQLKTFIHGMEVFHRKIILRRDSVILSKSRNRLRQRRNLSDERIESENSIRACWPSPPRCAIGAPPPEGGGFLRCGGGSPSRLWRQPPPVEGAFGAGAPFEPPGISAGSPRQRARWSAMTLLFERFDAMYGQVALNIF